MYSSSLLSDLVFRGASSSWSRREIFDCLFSTMPTNGKLSNEGGSSSQQSPDVIDEGHDDLDHEFPTTTDLCEVKHEQQKRRHISKSGAGSSTKTSIWSTIADTVKKVDFDGFSTALCALLRVSSARLCPAATSIRTTVRTVPSS